MTLSETMTVALGHPSLTTPNKTLAAADVLRMLKSEGQAWWARYKGHAGKLPVYPLLYSSY